MVAGWLPSVTHRGRHSSSRNVTSVSTERNDRSESAINAMRIARCNC